MSKLIKLINRKPVAILISDVHYNLQTLDVADKAMRTAIDHANKLKVPLIVCGDLHDTKANLRAECVNKILDTFRKTHVLPLVLVGNHCRVNEKSKEHALGFLHGLAMIYNTPYRWSHDFIGFDGYLIPYQSDTTLLTTFIRSTLPQLPLLMHQGVEGSNQGHYIKDPSAFAQKDLSGRRVISGHYHRRQTIELPNGGLLDYLGNPYTLSFGESEDPPKGYHVLYSNKDIEFHKLDLRKHVILTLEMNESGEIYNPNLTANPQDIVLVKLSGPRHLVNQLSKQELIKKYNISFPFKLDLIPTTQAKIAVRSTSINSFLDELDLTADQKQRLKELKDRL